MSRTSKSPRMVARTAMQVAESTLPAYSSHFSRQDFTLSQLFACLALKSFFKTDYRGIAAILGDCAELREELKLTRVPHFTTLQKAAERLLSFRPATQLLDTTVHAALGERPRVELAAGDSTGIETSQISPYFVRRRSHKKKSLQFTTYSHYPKLEVLCDCFTHIILSANTTLGPSPDTDRLRPLMIGPLSRGVRINTALFDAGYDSESNHQFLRDGCGIRGVIPPESGRPLKDPTRLPRSRWRRLMRLRRDYRSGQRWQVESVFSMIKRTQGAHVLSRSNQARARDIMLKVLTHNIMILLCWMWRVSTEQDAASF